VAYEKTDVSISKSQEGIRRLVYSHKGTGVSFISRPPREGFEAMVTINDLAYHIRIMATCRTVPKPGYKFTASGIEQEERRVWRVLYWHIKAMFEAADSGVIDIRDVIMPYVVTRDGRTLSEHIIPQMEETMSIEPGRLLAAVNK